MGIFSRRPKIPDPTITCAYSTNPSDPYHPNSPVSGAIGFTCPQQRHIRSIKISFYGHCLTHNTRQERTGGPNNQTRTVHYHDDVDLFRYVQDLTPQTGAFMAPLDEEMKFDFSFAFPPTTWYTRDDPYQRDTAGSEAYDVGQHDLPPSFGLGYGSSKVAEVEYRVEAAVIMDDNPEPFVVQFDPIPFSPFPPSVPPNYRPPFLEFVRKTETYASSRLIGQEKSFRATIRDKFSSHTPSLEVTMKASLVPVITVGMPFELFVCVELSRLSDPRSTSVPNVQLKVKKLRLYENIKFRALRTSYGHRYPENERMDERDTALNAVPELRVVEQQGAPPPAYQPPPPSDEKRDTKEKQSPSFSGSAAGVDPSLQLIFPTSFEARIPGDMSPSFRTVNINHHYQLEVEVEVVIAEKEFEHKFGVDDVTVLPPAMGVTVGAGGTGLPGYDGAV